jgi:hypothetical protein
MTGLLFPPFGKTVAWPCRSDAEVDAIITDAGKLPLHDAAYALWRQMSRIDRLDGRPTPEEVRINRTLTPE